MESKRGAAEKMGIAGLSEQELVEQAQQGNNEACQKLFEQHKNQIFSCIKRICGDADRAENLTQDAFSRAFEKIKTFRFEAKFSTWLHALAINLTFNELRRTPPPKALTEDLTDEGRASRSIETRLELDEAIDRLPHGERQAIVLKDVEGYTYSEVADRMNLTVAEAKRLCRTAREKLRARLSH